MECSWLLHPSPWQLSRDRSRAQSSLRTPAVTAAASVLRAETGHSCSGRVKDERGPAAAPQASRHESPIPEPLPQSIKRGGGQGQGAQGSHGPTSWGELRAILFPRWEQQGQRGESIFPVLTFTLYYCCFQQTCLAGGAGGGDCKQWLLTFSSCQILNDINSPAFYFFFNLFYFDFFFLSGTAS